MELHISGKLGSVFKNFSKKMATIRSGLSLTYSKICVAPQRVFTDLSPTALTKRLSEGGIRGLDD